MCKTNKYWVSMIWPNGIITTQMVTGDKAWEKALLIANKAVAFQISNTRKEARACKGMLEIRYQGWGSPADPQRIPEITSDYLNLCNTLPKGLTRSALCRYVGNCTTKRRAAHKGKV